MPLFALLVVIAVAIFAFNDTRVVDAQDDVGFTLVAFDATLTRIEDIEAAQLAANIVLSDAGDGLVIVGKYFDHAEEPQIFGTSDQAKAAVNDITEELKSNAGGESLPADLSEMFETYAVFVESLGVQTGGRLVILSAGGFTYHESVGVDGLASVAADLAAQGVEVSTVSLATTPAVDRDVLGAISSAGGGIPYDLGFSDGVLEFVNNELNVQLTASVQIDDLSSGVDAIDVPVPPHSSYLVAGFLYEDPESSHVIVEPNGQEITSSVGSVSALSISGIKFFTVRNPQAGTWSLRSSGSSGSLTILSDVVNGLNIGMPPQVPFPTGESFVIVAEARIGELPLIDTSAIVEAVIVLPDGSEQTFALNDTGDDGDVFSEDGVFSATIPAQAEAWIAEARLSMRWPNIAATIDGAGVIVVEPFPTIEITLDETDEPVAEATRTQLATVDLKLGEFPFLAEQDGIAVSMVNTEDGSVVDLELEPTEVVDAKVYQLKVFGSLTLPAEYEFSATLSSVHLGRDFETVAAKKSKSIEISTSTPILTYSLVGIGGLFGLLLLVLVLRSLMQVKPYGYLYRLDGQGERELAVDFGAYRRSAWDALMNKPIVPAAALPGVPLLGGRFVFSSRGLAFRYRPDSDGLLRMTIRGEALQEGRNPIPDGDEVHIGSETFVFDRAAIDGESHHVRSTASPNEESKHRTGHLRPRPYDLGCTIKRAAYSAQPLTLQMPDNQPIGVITLSCYISIRISHTILDVRHCFLNTSSIAPSVSDTHRVYGGIRNRVGADVSNRLIPERCPARNQRLNPPMSH